ncbi:(deoxy)nucleoside triphosphate pyrophosphohydrolase [Pedobacter cryotolerans]|uniref:8-oxo-dGTP diphosphatase n=1 Tax=Pedobacter cryotolerans TaxID=2571270 RepID=A0A4U1BZF6_9SPHI|nr:(deoxy)nucleoside triphosphate pyrophosphohydrolase [Pedobacter cryotolerans]TKB98024.1 (deoxy)nucleoside triphosphate pyrophosphohydrolase [Pedobacter cryotolerans]
MPNNPIRVTCAIIIRNNKTLAVQRSQKMKLPLKWEFPGGKIELGETEEKCILREIKEELDLEIDLVSRLTPSQFQYPNLSIELIPFIAQFKSGDINLAEHKRHLWLKKEELIDLDWAEADLPILKEYLTV